MDDNCRLCTERLPKKNRRSVFSDSFLVTKQLIEVIGCIPNRNDSCSSFICYRCFNKLNKLSKIDFDLQNKLTVLHIEKQQIISELRAKANFSSPPISEIQHVQTHSTPQKSGKRIIIHTPTPRKVKKCHVSTPAKIYPAARKRLGVELAPDQVKVIWDLKSLISVFEKSGLHFFKLRNSRPSLFLYS